MIIYLDTETTGLRPGEICQLSYIIQDGENITAKNFFFAVNFMEKSAEMVHGFSISKLLVLSGGKKFAESADEVAKDFVMADVIVSHNIAFDFMFLRTEFEKANVPLLYNRTFCSMKEFTPICKLKRSSTNAYKFPRLSELCAYLNITDKEISDETKRLFGTLNGFHDARFDTSAVFLAVNKALGIGIDLGEIKNYL